MFELIVATDLRGGIAKEGKIPWHYPEDLKHFKKMTTGYIVIMGRKTYESIGHPLPNRVNIVICNLDYAGQLPSSVLNFQSIEAMIYHCAKNFPTERKFIIGGAAIYDWFMRNKYISKVHLTRIGADYKCDQFFHFDEIMYEAPENILIIYDDNPYFYKLKIDTYTLPNNEEDKVLRVIKKTLSYGVFKSDRTGLGTYSTFGNTFKFDLQNHTFPLMTTRPMYLRGIFEELMLYLRGQTDSKILESKKINVWRKNTTREFLDARGLTHLPVGDMGPSYGFLFRHFGATYQTCHTDYTGQGIDQLRNLIDKLKNNPNDRRMIISLWDPRVVDECPLPPCLYNYQFYVENNHLHLMMTQRSSDIAVAGGWNIATGALLVYLLCSMLYDTTQLSPGTLTWNIGDTHIYSNLVEQMKVQVERSAHMFPKLFITAKKDITEYEFSDLLLVNYNPDEQIKLVMNV